MWILYFRNEVFSKICWKSISSAIHHSKHQKSWYILYSNVASFQWKRQNPKCELWYKAKNNCHRLLENVADRLNLLKPCTSKPNANIWFEKIMGWGKEQSPVMTSNVFPLMILKEIANRYTGWVPAHLDKSTHVWANRNSKRWCFVFLDIRGTILVDWIH